MSRSLVAILIAFGIAAVTPAQVKPPTLGIARLGDGSVRTLYGLPDNVIVDSHSIGSYDAASFSDQAGLVANSGRIQLVSTSFVALGEYESTEPHPLLNVDGAANSAIAWLPSSQSLLHWTGSAFAERVVNGIDHSFAVTAVRVASREIAQLLLTDSHSSVFEATISLETGDVVSLKSLAGVTGPALWQGSNILFQDSSSVRVASLDGAVRSIASSGAPFSFEHISSNWTLVTSTTNHSMWVLHSSTGQLRLSEVPAVPAAIAPEGTK